MSRKSRRGGVRRRSPAAPSRNQRPALQPISSPASSEPPAPAVTAVVAPPLPDVEPLPATTLPPLAEHAAAEPLPAVVPSPLPEKHRRAGGVRRLLISAGRMVGGLWRTGMPADLLAVVLLLALCAVFYRSLLTSGRIASDPVLFREVYPLLEVIGDALGDGRMPLWNPYLFTGVPLLAEVRSAAVYPGWLLLRWWDAPDAFRLATVAHSAIALTGMYLFVRRGLQLVSPAAFVAAMIVGLGGYLGAAAVEPAAMQSAAWSPWALLGAALAVRRSVAGGCALGGLALALGVLAGQPLTSALTLLAIWLLLMVLAAPATGGLRGASWRNWLARLLPAGKALVAAVAIPTIAAGLAAVQLLPAHNLYQSSRRADTFSYDRAVAGALPAGATLRALLPGFSENPPRQWTAHVGLVAVGLAVLGLRRGGRAAAFGLLVTLTGLAVALGDATPVHRLLLNLAGRGATFEQPARGLLLVTVGLAVLAAAGLDALWPGPERRRRVGWLPYWRDAVVALAGSQVLLVLVINRHRFDWPGAGVREIWLGLSVIAVDVAVILPLLRPRRWLALAVVPVLAAELLIAGAQLPFTQTAPPVAFAVEAPLAALLHGGDGPARIARLAGYATTDPAPEPGFAAVQALRQGRDRLAPNSAILDRLNALEGLVGPVTPAPELRALWSDGTSVGVLPANIHGLLGPRLGVTHVFGPASQPLRAGATEFITGLPLDVAAGKEVRLPLPGGLASTGLALLADLTDAPADGQPAIELTVSIAGGPDRVRLLVSGVDAGDARSLPESRLLSLADGGSALPAEQELGRPAVFQMLTIQNVTDRARLRLYAVSLLDSRSGASRPVILDTALQVIPGTVPLLYLDRRTPARAALTRTFDVEPEAAEAVARLSELPLERVLVDRPPGPAIAQGAPMTAGEVARIARYAPDRVEVLTSSYAPALLVLRDAWAAGWQVSVDGSPAPLLRVDGLFRGVAVTEGTHIVVFRYQPPGLRTGLIISAVSLWVTLALLVLLAPRPGRARAAAARPGGI